MSSDNNTLVGFLFLTQPFPLAFFCLIVASAIGIVVVYRVYFHPLASTPGPRIAKITGLWRTWRYFRMSWHDDILHLHNTYGPVVRVAPNEISLVDAHAMKQLYSHGHNAKKTSWYNTWGAGVPGMHVFFNETDTRIHSALRRRVSAAYSMTAILKYEKHIQECLDLCFKKFTKYSHKGLPIDMSEWTHAFAFDVVGELAFGQKLGHLESEKDIDNLRRSNTADFYWAGNFGHIWFQAAVFQNPLVNGLLQFFGQASGSVKFQNWVYQRVLSRKQGRDDPQREDMLTYFLNMKPLEGKREVDDMEVLIETANVLGAGADTTAIGIRSCLYFLCMHPEVYRRLQADIDDYYVQNRLEQPMTYLQTQEMPYLKAVIAEATRLLPSIAYQLLRETPESGLTVNGHFIPPGTPVGMSPLAQNRDKSIWGQDANEFRPERWMEDRSKLASYESSSMTYGGNGPRACIGKNLALVEMSKFVAQLLRNFDMEIYDKQNPWKVKTYWLMDQTEFNMWVRARHITPP